MLEENPRKISEKIDENDQLKITKWFSFQWENFPFSNYKVNAMRLLNYKFEFQFRFVKKKEKYDEKMLIVVLKIFQKLI